MQQDSLHEQNLHSAVEILIAADNSRFGFSDEALARARRVLVERGAHDRLFTELEAALQRPLGPSERILEVGCGTCTFLLSLLERGHDAYGIDNSAERLRVALAKIPHYDFPSQWSQRMIEGDATRLPYESSSFDLIVGHQFIEHVSSVANVMFELVRVLRRGGSIVLWAPDYRAPFEAHYEIPWPPFAPRSVAEAWVEEFNKPAGGIDDFNYVTLPQVISVLQGLACAISRAWTDKIIDPNLLRYFDFGDASSLRESARRLRAMKGALPPQLSSPTSFGIVARKP